MKKITNFITKKQVNQILTPKLINLSQRKFTETFVNDKFSKDKMQVKTPLFNN
jgi:hypothetical protein